MSDNKIEAAINGDNIELKDDTYQYLSIPINEWQEMKDSVDKLLAGSKCDTNTYPPIALTKDTPIPDSEFGGDDE